MTVEIRNTPLVLALTGAAKTHDPDKNIGEELIGLLDIVWNHVRSHGIQTTGINYAVYGEQGEIFAGVIFNNPSDPAGELTPRQIVLERYAYLKHVGPYTGLAQAYEALSAEVARQGLVRKSPTIEIYGHWTEDATKLETELIFALE